MGPDGGEFDRPAYQDGLASSVGDRQPLELFKQESDTPKASISIEKSQDTGRIRLGRTWPQEEARTTQRKRQIWMKVEGREENADQRSVGVWESLWEEGESENVNQPG